MSDCPLTPAEAIADAALLDCDKRLPATWRDVAARLRTWGQQQIQTEHEESEMPSQDRVSGSADGTIRTSNRTTPGERVNAQTEGLTTDYVGV